jgi:predicted Zn finger-like uncharacterized protein
MITTCTECQARYQLEDEKIPRRQIRVRCPACSGVFGLDGTQAGSAAVEPAAPVEAVTSPPADPAPAQDDFVVSNGFDTSFAPDPEPQVSAAPPVESAPAATVESLSQPAQAPVAVLDEEVAPPSPARRRRSKEEMLARALVSDILVYNRELRDKAMADGNLLEVLGGEIKKSWELYKEKVTPEVANSTNHFRDALNEILADGNKVF